MHCGLYAEDPKGKKASIECSRTGGRRPQIRLREGKKKDLGKI